MTPTPCALCGHPASIGAADGTLLCPDCAATALPDHPVTHPPGHVNDTEASDEHHP